MEQQHWPAQTPPAPPGRPPPAEPGHGSQDAEAWAVTPWAVVTATGIVQARCGHATSGEVCGAWRLSAPGGSAGSPAIRAAASRSRPRFRPPAPRPPPRSLRPDRRRASRHDHAPLRRGLPPGRGAVLSLRECRWCPWPADPLPSPASLAGPVRRRRPTAVSGRGLRRPSWAIAPGPAAATAMIALGAAGEPGSGRASGPHPAGHRRRRRRPPCPPRPRWRLARRGWL